MDTSAFVALRNAAENEHKAARRVMLDLVAERASLFTSDYVFAETFTALLARVGRDEAVNWGKAFRSGSAIELLRSDEGIAEDAWSILESVDKKWSYVDATSFAFMSREGVDEAFSFDRNFTERGLRVLP